MGPLSTPRAVRVDRARYAARRFARCARRAARPTWLWVPDWYVLYFDTAPEAVHGSPSQQGPFSEPQAGADAGRVLSERIRAFGLAPEAQQDQAAGWPKRSEPVQPLIW